MVIQPIIKNDVGQVVNIGTVIVYPKVIGTTKVRMTAGVVINIADHPKGPKLQVMVPSSVRPVLLSNVLKVIVVDINTLDLPQENIRLIREAIAKL